MTLVPMVRRPIASTGRTTGHGWTVSPLRFSLTISPQSAAGGWSPKPRNESDAISAIEKRHSQCGLHE